jgi:glycosidase
VATESADPDSVLACYERLLDARRATRALQDGSLTLVRTGDPTVLGYRRDVTGSGALVLISFGPNPGVARIVEPAAGAVWRPVAGSHRDLPERLLPGARVHLRPFEAIVAVTSDD